MTKKMCNLKAIVLLFMAVGLLTAFVGCSDKNDGGPLKEEVKTLKSDLAGLQTKLDQKSGDYDTDLANQKKQLADLMAKYDEVKASGKATQTDLDNLKSQIEQQKKDLVNSYLSKESFESYKAQVKEEMDMVKADKADKATVESLQATVDNFNGKADAQQKEIDELKKKVADLEVLAGDTSAVDNLKSDLMSEIENLRQELTTDYDGKLNKVIEDAKKELAASVEELNNKIEAQKTELTELANSYKTELTALITANLNKIQANTNKIAALDTKYGKLLGDLKVEFTNMVNGRLTSLVIIPDYVADNGGALPLVYFGGLKTDCGLVTAGGDDNEVVVKYRVNPSTVTAADIDTEGLKVLYNDPQVMKRITNTGITAKFKSLENGVLSVAISMKDQNLHGSGTDANGDKNDENRINQIMLQVPTKDGSVVVSSDWAKVVYGSKDATIVTSKLLNSDQKYDDNYVVKNTLQEAKDIKVNQSPENTTVVDIEEGENLDLNTVVKALYSDLASAEDIQSKYGLHFEFNEKDKDGNDIVYNLGGNNTDQQEFLTLTGENGATAITKVYTEDSNNAAVGRTPIVHVMLKSGDCKVKEGFIKLNIVKKKLPSVPPVEVTPKDNGNYTAECDTYLQKWEGENPNKDKKLYMGRQIVVRVGTQEMNEKIYHEVDMSKEDFHTMFPNFEAVPVKEEVKPEGGAVIVGEVEQIPDANDPTSYNLIYTLSEDEVFKNAGKTVQRTGIYKDATGRYSIKVVFRAKIVNHKVVIDAIINNYWYDTNAKSKSEDTGNYNTIVQNVAVPKEGSTDSDKATYKNNINNAFETKAGQLAEFVGKDNTYKYEFTKKNQPLKNTTVSNDGQTLYYNGTEVAKIVDETYIQYADNDVAKELLNMGPEYSKARVELVVSNSCGRKLDLTVKKLQDKNKFNVIFLRPINVKPTSAKDLKDGVDKGAEGSYVEIKDLVQLSDWRNYVTNKNKYDFLPDHENYFDYYGVKKVTVDVPNIKPEGLYQGDKELEKVPETIEIEQTDKDKPYPFGRLTYHNNGNNLAKEFYLHVPVTVEYKWGKVSTNVKVTVKPTSQAAKRRK